MNVLAATSFIPKEVLFLVVALLMFRSFQYVLIGIAATGVGGVVTSIANSFLDASFTPVFFVLGFLVGTAISFYTSEEQPPVFMIFLVVGVLMVAVHVSEFQAMMPSFSFPDLPI
ncbi:hypothetical protein ACFYKX_11760 [Cytobacillus sp. FJAT-54145]|uniref:Uncharacterized protein n=1 Tax=Cytobacillus spartinae TaxID=3299023 RepID=A0ABW6KCF7_9BACI